MIFVRSMFLVDTKWKFHKEYDVTKWAHNPTGFGVYLK